MVVINLLKKENIMKQWLKWVLVSTSVVLLTACGGGGSSEESVDSTKPVIILNDDANISLNVGETYTEAGATATDDVDGTVTVTTTGSVDTTTAGTYTITYTATDSAGNEAVATRTITVSAVIVPDTTKPVITLNGDASLSLNVGDTYTEAGATATDNVDDTVTVTTTGSVDTSTAGTYTITYTATDSAGNEATVTRTITVSTVIVPDTTKPVITLNGDASLSLNVGDTYTEAGATATDDRDATVTVTTSGTVDVNTVGSYTITYKAVDSAGNEAVATRTVNVVLPPDTTKPVITLNGDENMTVLQNNSYIEMGATALDDIDGNIAVEISGNVDVNISGNYIITYTATDEAGNIATKNRYVLVSEIQILSDLTLSSDSAYVNISKDIVARIALDNNITKVVLLNDNNQIIELKDDGDVENGDDILGDGIFSGKFTVLEDSQKELEYQVKINDKYFSSKATIDIFEELTDQVIEEAKIIVNKSLELFPKDINLTDENLTNTLGEIVNFLKNDENIKDVNSSDDKMFIQYTTKAGYNGEILFTTVDNETGEITKGIQRNSDNINYTKYKNPLLTKNSLSKNGYSNIIQKSVSNTVIGNTNVLVLDPFKYQFGEYGAYGQFLNNTYFANHISYFANYDVTAEKFKNLDKYGVVIISTHANGTGVILTGQEATSDIKKKYSLDAKKGRLSFVVHEVLVKDGGFWFWEDDDVEQEKEVVMLDSSFIAYYNKGLPNSLVFLGMCEGMMKDNPLPKIFIKSGAKSVVGYNDTVNSSYDDNIVSTFFSEMLDNKTLKESLDKAKIQHGNNDESNGQVSTPPTPAEPVFIGNANLKLFNDGIENGSFEENLKFWEIQGDTRVISKLAELKPQDGSYMSIISTGLGANNDANSYIQQRFTVPSNITKLKFSYDVVSEEPMEYVGSSFDDKFEVHLIDEEGNDNLITEESINASTWYPIEGIDFAGGDDTVYHTQWKHKDIDISAYQGQAITIKFLVYDKGDSAYDTATLLDDVNIQ